MIFPRQGHVANPGGGVFGGQGEKALGLPAGSLFESPRRGEAGRIHELEVCVQVQDPGDDDTPWSAISPSGADSR